MATRIMKTTDNKTEVYTILANNRYAKRPDHISARRWSAIQRVMEDKFMKEYMDTPEGLYTNAQIWKQTFKQYINE